MSNFNEKDPIYQLGKRHYEQNVDRTMQKIHQWGQLERSLQGRLSRFFLFGLPRLLWQRSKVALFLYFIPFWVFVLAVASFTAALASDPPYAIGFYILGGLFFLLMLGSMVHGFRQSFGFVRIVSMLQMGTVIIFVTVAIYRAINAPQSDIPFAPESIECGIGLLTMTILFGITVITDLILAFRNRRAME